MGPVLARYLFLRFTGLYLVLLAACGLFLAAALGLDRAGAAALSAGDWLELAPLGFLLLSPLAAAAASWLLAANLVRENHLPALQGAGVAPRRIAAVVVLAAGLAAALETAASEALVPARLGSILAVVGRLGFDTLETNFPVLAGSPEGLLAGARRVRGEALERPWVWGDGKLHAAPSGRILALPDGGARLELPLAGGEVLRVALAAPGLSPPSPDRPTVHRLREHRRLDRLLRDLDQGRALPGDGLQAARRLSRPVVAPLLALLAFLAGLALEGRRKYGA